MHLEEDVLAQGALQLGRLLLHVGQLALHLHHLLSPPLPVALLRLLVLLLQPRAANRLATCEENSQPADPLGCLPNLTLSAISAGQQPAKPLMQNKTNS